jgi:hypothetical protein
LTHTNAAIEQALKDSKFDVAAALCAAFVAILHLYKSDRGKVCMVFTENGLSVSMLKGPEGKGIIGMSEMMELINRFDELFEAGRVSGKFPQLCVPAAREAFIGMIEGTILGWLLAEASEPDYHVATVSEMQEIMARFLHGLSHNPN